MHYPGPSHPLAKFVQSWHAPRICLLVVTFYPHTIALNLNVQAVYRLIRQLRTQFAIRSDNDYLGGRT
jgi:hypothetical protein